MGRGHRTSGQCVCERIGGAPLLPLAKQAPRNDLCLYFGSPFKNIEDAGITQHTANLVFQCETVAPMNLQAIVCSGPGDARAQ